MTSHHEDAWIADSGPWELALTRRARLRGLLFRKPGFPPMVLAPCNDVHTWGMTRPIDVAFLDRDGRVIESHVHVGPRRRLRCKSAVATVERFSTGGGWVMPGEKTGIGFL